ncbi:MAG: hypothetical protein AB7G11_10965 [Phycisphaerales bacterium]
MAERLRTAGTPAAEAALARTKRLTAGSLSLVALAPLLHEVPKRQRVPMGEAPKPLAELLGVVVGELPYTLTALTAVVVGVAPLTLAGLVLAVPAGAGPVVIRTRPTALGAPRPRAALVATPSLDPIRAVAIITPRRTTLVQPLVRPLAIRRSISIKHLRARSVRTTVIVPSTRLRECRREPGNTERSDSHKYGTIHHRYS